MELPNDRGALKEMCAQRGVPYSPKDALERVKNRLRKAPPNTVLHERGGGGLSDDDDVDMSNGHGSNGHTNGHGVDEDAARDARRMSVGELRTRLGRRTGRSQSQRWESSSTVTEKAITPSATAAALYSAVRSCARSCAKARRQAASRCSWPRSISSAKHRGRDAPAANHPHTTSRRVGERVSHTRKRDETHSSPERS